MKRALPAPTNEEIERWALLKMLGCIACRLWSKLRPYAIPEVHHINEGNRNVGHWQTIPLCPWHHRGVCYSGLLSRDMVKLMGPSLAHGSKPFEAAFGTERRLWIVVQRFFKLDRRWPESKIAPRRVVNG